MLTLDGLEKWYVQTVNLKHAFAGTTPPDPVPLPDVTTVDGLLEGIATETEEAFVAAADYAGKLHGEDVVYKLDLPAEIKRWYGLKSVGGKSIVYNQQVDDSNIGSSTISGVVVSKTNHVITLKGTATAAATVNFRSTNPYYAGHKYLVTLKRTARTTGGNVRVYDTTHSKNIINSGSGTGDRIFTAEEDFNGRYYFNCASGVNVDFDIVPQFFDLTLMFGAGNEPATVEEFRSMFPQDYYSYSTGEMKDIKVTSVISADSNGNVLETINIPAEVQALTGYGMSCPGKSNHIDTEAQKFVQEVGSRAYASGDDSDTTVITDGTTTRYPLTTPVETDITIAGDIAYEAGGSITFDNTDKMPATVNVGYIG